MTLVWLFVQLLFRFRWHFNSPVTFCAAKSWANTNTFTTSPDLRRLRFQSLILWRHPSWSRHRPRSLRWTRRPRCRRSGNLPSSSPRRASFKRCWRRNFPTLFPVWWESCGLRQPEIFSWLRLVCLTPLPTINSQAVQGKTSEDKQ